MPKRRMSRAASAKTPKRRCASCGAAARLRRRRKQLEEKQTEAKQQAIPSSPSPKAVRKPRRTGRRKR